jgi:hypothetical protein
VQFWLEMQTSCDISVSFYEHSTAFVNGTGKMRHEQASATVGLAGATAAAGAGGSCIAWVNSTAFVNGTGKVRHEHISATVVMTSATAAASRSSLSMLRMWLQRAAGHNCTEMQT